MELGEAMERSRTLKEQRVASTYGDDPGDIEPILWIERLGRIVATIEAPGGRDAALLAAHVSARGYGADLITLAIDAHMTRKPVDPRTGRAWAPGSMQQFCDQEHGCDLGVITDCLLVVRATRLGNLQHGMLPYHVHKTARTVAWIGEPEIADEGSAVGNIPESLVATMTAPHGIDVARSDPRTDYLSREELQTRFDEATTAALVMFGFSVHPGRALP